MQLKHLIIFALVGMALLLGFNIVNSNRHENNRALAANTYSLIETNTADSNTVNVVSNSTDIDNKPLGEQPKAIIDKATIQIDDAEQADKERLAQMDNEH